MKAVIFDLDGTLVSVTPEYREWIVNKTLSDYGLKKGVHDVERFWFSHGRDEIVKSWGIDVQGFWKAFDRYDTVEKRREATYAYEDLDALRQLKDRGLRLAIFTGTRPHIAEMELDFLDRSLFDAVIVAHPHNGIKVKPDPMGALECIRLLGADRKETYYVGNADDDIIAAREAGVQSILIDRKEHKATLQAGRRIESLHELLTLI